MPSQLDEVQTCGKAEVNTMCEISNGLVQLLTN